MKRGASGISCLLAIDKPINFTSHDVVNVLRKSFNERRVGHGGTLDPFATGVLPCMVGSATKLSQYFNNCSKDYVAKIAFGTSTVTDDVTGDVLEVGQVSSELADEEFANEVLMSFTGKIRQLPPKFSAIKINGKHSYERARVGEDVHLRFREVNVYEANLLEITSEGEKGKILWKVKFSVGSGTYIRSLARDIGVRVGCPSHLKSLCRTRVGGISLLNCSEQKNIKSIDDARVIDPCKAIPLLTYRIDKNDFMHVKDGHPIDFDLEKVCMTFTNETKSYSSDVKDGTKFFLANESFVFAVYSLFINEGVLKPQTVFNLGVKRCLQQ